MLLPLQSEANDKFNELEEQLQQIKDQIKVNTDVWCMQSHSGAQLQGAPLQSTGLPRLQFVMADFGCACGIVYTSTQQLQTFHRRLQLFRVQDMHTYDTTLVVCLLASRVVLCCADLTG